MSEHLKQSADSFESNPTPKAELGKLYPDEYAIAGDLPGEFVLRWYWQVGCERNYERSQLEASVALILGVWQAMGGE